MHLQQATGVRSPCALSAACGRMTACIVTMECSAGSVSVFCRSASAEPTTWMSMGPTILRLCIGIHQHDAAGADELSSATIRPWGAGSPARTSSLSRNLPFSISLMQATEDGASSSLLPVSGVHMLYTLVLARHHNACKSLRTAC